MTDEVLGQIDDFGWLPTQDVCAMSYFLKQQLESKLLGMEVVDSLHRLTSLSEPSTQQHLRSVHQLSHLQGIAGWALASPQGS